MVNGTKHSYLTLDGVIYRATWGDNTLIFRYDKRKKFCMFFVVDTVLELLVVGGVMYFCEVDNETILFLCFYLLLSKIVIKDFWTIYEKIHR